MTVSATGAIGDYRFFPAVMHSRARLTYNQVWSWLSDPDAAPPEAQPLLPHLKQLYAVFKALLAAREKRGAIDFDTVETQLEFDIRGKIVRVVPAVRNDAHRLIEECMLAANVCTAQYLAAQRAPGAVPRPRHAAAGQARRSARLPRRLRARAVRRRRADRV